MEKIVGGLGGGSTIRKSVGVGRGREKGNRWVKKGAKFFFPFSPPSPLFNGIYM